jgi:hypothetical protein
MACMVLPFVNCSAAVGTWYWGWGLGLVTDLEIFQLRPLKNP